MSSPKIEILDIVNNYRYLWLKYVTGVNLNEHCAKCLKGSYSKKIGNTSKLINNNGLELNEHVAEYYYLCGVINPYNWNNNLHLAFKHKINSTIETSWNGDRIVINNAEKIIINKLDYYNHVKGNIKSFNTCRNWRFAYQISKK